MPLDDDARSVIERNVDIILEDVMKSKETFSYILKQQNIEPNLETLLSYITGYIIGIVQGVYAHKLNRILTYDERTELLNLIKRRSWEIKQAFMVQPIE